MQSRNKLHAYQNKGVDFIKNINKCALWLDMGLGKTLTTLTAIADLSDSFDVYKTLIIAPLRVANTTWHTELQRWEHTKHLTYSICTGDKKQRLTALMKPADIYIINREQIAWLVDYYRDKWPFDCVVIDESSSFKSASSQRFKALRKVSHHIDRMIQLTGTPSPNGLLDVWSQVALLDNGQRLGRTMTQYKQRYFTSDYMGFKFVPSAGTEARIHEKLSDIILSMSADDYLELPKRINLYERIELPAPVIKAYKEFERELLIELGGGEDVSAPSAAVLANKLLQFANGALYLDETHRYQLMHEAKLDALEQILADNPNENVLIAYNYKFDLEQLQKRFPEAVVMSRSGGEVERWNNCEIKILLAHPASAGHGLNLQNGGSLLVWYGLTWSLELYQQFNARLHRQGQTKPVRILHLLAQDTIDTRVISVLKDKDITQGRLLAALKSA